MIMYLMYIDTTDLKRNHLMTEKVIVETGTNRKYVMDVDLQDNFVEWISDRDVAQQFSELGIHKYRHAVDRIAGVKTRLELA